MEEKYAEIAFSVEDPIFQEFLPADPQDQISNRWMDYNVHDPGVTTLEALLFSFEDLYYKYQQPIENLLQGPGHNALDSWRKQMLNLPFCVTENDYRYVLAGNKHIHNAAVFPYTPTGRKQMPTLINLLRVWIAQENGQELSVEVTDEIERGLIRYRGLGEYFFAPEGESSFVEVRVKSVEIEVDIDFEPWTDDKPNRQTIFKVLSNLLLPSLKQNDLRYELVASVEELHLNVGRSPESVITDVSKLSARALYQDENETEAYSLLNSLSFVRTVTNLSVTVEGGEAKPQGHYFFQLKQLKVNGNIVPVPVPSLEKRVPVPKTSIQGSYLDAGAFRSIQLSFPPNYELGTYLPEKVEGPTGFRRYLGLMDQIRANHGAQLGQLPSIFSAEALSQTIANSNIGSEVGYKGLNWPGSEIGNYPKAEKKWFRESRLNYLLALNGWQLPENYPPEWTEKQVSKMKLAFLQFLHEGLENDHLCEDSLNPVFASRSLSYYQKALQLLLRPVASKVRIFEHWLLAWLRPESIPNALQLNFEVTVLVFLKPKRYKTYLDRMEQLNSVYSWFNGICEDIIPAHFRFRIRWCSQLELAHYEELLTIAYPPEEILNMSADASEVKQDAMRALVQQYLYPERKPR